MTKINFTNYIAKHARNFTGRQWVFRSIHKWLSDPDGSRYFLLTGEPGSGKTSIAAELVQISQGKPTPSTLNSEFPSSTLTPGFLSAFHFCSAGRSNWTDPRNFACSIALQLSSIIPKYAEALKDIGDKQVNVKVDIEIREANNNVIQGVVINNLSLAGLSGQEAFNRVVLDPINIIYYEEGFESQIIILIDSLDEALTYSDGKNIINIISELQDLPPNVRFICTTRPVRLVLSYLKTLELYEYPLVKDSQVNQRDLDEYIDEQSDAEKIQRQLQEFNVERHEFVSRLTEIADGNFLVASHIFSEIEGGRLAPNNLSNALKGFASIYQSFLRRLSQNDWDSKHQPILGILSVAQEALTKEQLVNFLATHTIKITPTILESSLRILVQYLEESESDAYSLHHAALREYLLDKERNQDFWCDAKEFHNLIIRFYNILDASSFNSIDVYGLRHLAKHLTKITLSNELLALLSKQSDDGQNAWFKAKSKLGESATFLDDIELLIQNLPRELSSEEFKALINIDSLSYQVELIIKLACRYPDSVLSEALNIAIGSTDDHYKKRLLTALVDKFPPKLLSKASEVALAIKDNRSRAKALTALAYTLPEAFPEALASAKEIQDDFHRAEALAALAEIQPELVPQALDAALSIQNERSRAEVLTVLADKLPEAVPPALETVQSISPESYRAKAFITLVDKLTPQLLPQALEGVKAFQNEKFRAEALISLLDNLPLALLQEALKMAKAIHNEFYKAQVLAALADKLPLDLLTQVLNTAGTFENMYARVKVLTALISKMPQVLSPALEVIQFIQNEYYRTKALTAIASQLSDNLSEYIKVLPFALEVVQSIQDESYQTKALTAIASQLPDNLPEYIKILPPALEVVQSIQDESYQTKVLAAIASQLPDNSSEYIKILPPALEVVQSIQDESYQTKVLAAIASQLPDNSSEPIKVLPLALEVVQSIQDESYRTQALTAIASQLPDNVSEYIKVLPLALEVVQSIQDESYRTQALTAITSQLPDNPWKVINIGFPLLLKQFI